MEKRHAIIIIKDKQERYLQIFQDSWNSYLFLNCKVKNESDNESISKYIKDVLGVEPNKIEYKFDKVHTKFSQKDKIDKKYHHYFFDIDIELNNETTEFIKNNNKFKWYLYKDLLNDDKIMQVNSDIVTLIKDI